MSESSEDRKARLAALRRSRNNQKDGEQSTQQTASFNDKRTLQVQIGTTDSDNKPKEEDTEIPHKPPVFQLANGETVEAVSQRIQDEILRKAHDDLIETSEYPIPEKISYTKDLKDDLKPYYHKASIRTERAINSILLDRYKNSSNS